MMGERTGLQETLFYGFGLEYPRPFYSQMGCPSIDPELLIRMLLIGYCMGIRSVRPLCEEVHLNLAYR